MIRIAQLDSLRIIPRYASLKLGARYRANRLRILQSLIMAKHRCDRRFRGDPEWRLLPIADVQNGEFWQARQAASGQKHM